MVESPVGSLVALVVCFISVVLTVLTRTGVVRFWMNPVLADWRMERLVLLGLPLLAVTALGVALIAAPVQTPILRLLGGVVLLLTVVPWVFTTFFTTSKIPRVLYPRWAREVQNRRLFGPGRW